MSLMEKSSEGATYVFLDQMLSQYRAPIEALIDQGMDFQGEFQALCKQSLIDYPLEEKLVFATKFTTKKYCLQLEIAANGVFQLQKLVANNNFSFSDHTTLCDHTKANGLVKKCCVNNLKRFVKIWLEERTFVQLGPIIAMVGYGLLI